MYAKTTGTLCSSIVATAPSVWVAVGLKPGNPTRCETGSAITVPSKSASGAPNACVMYFAPISASNPE
jgi:hypothetical protein